MLRNYVDPCKEFGILVLFQAMMKDESEFRWKREVIYGLRHISVYTGPEISCLQNEGDGLDHWFLDILRCKAFIFAPSQENT